jgi:hypothetical protein
MEDVERGRERRYHSSGTENRKQRLAFAENPGGVTGESNNSEKHASEVSVEASGRKLVMG